MERHSALRITRRTVVAAVAPLALPRLARAQPTDRTARVGVLMNYAATQAEGQSFVAAFVDGMRALGWTEGRNLRLDVRWNAGDAGLARLYGAQLIGLSPDVIVASSTTNLRIIEEATSTVPVVFESVTDPVAQGFVPSLSRPGGNITGFSTGEFSVGGKWLGLLKEAVPALTRAALLYNPDTSPQAKFFLRAINAGAPSLGVTVVDTPVRDEAAIEPALASFAQQPNGGLILTTDSFTQTHQKPIAELAARYRLPSISYAKSFAADGGLLVYSSTGDQMSQFRLGAGYVDRILKGEKPGDLPVQMEERVQFIINLKTAKALGLTLAPTLLARADEVIE